MTAGHETISLGMVRLALYRDRLKAGGQKFPLEEISDMAMVQNCRLLFTAQGQYYELVAEKNTGMNLLKYLDLYRIAREPQNN